ncbi:amino acid adenylation domain-containing protein [Lysinibacillus fusiformis]|uniref:amino acid adenylation domain-containing protein n=1 Tax=Lysinibacillus fusiformis TaxID=28031 RepID=UPI0038087444
MGSEQITKNIILTNQEFIQKKKFWEEQLLSDSLVEPTSISIYKKKSNNLKKQFDIPIQGELHQQLQILSQGNPNSLYTILSSVVAILIQKYQREHGEIHLVSPVFEKIVNETTWNDCILLKYDSLVNHTFRSYLRKMKDVIRESYKNQSYPLELILEDTQNKELHDYSRVVCLLNRLHDKRRIENINAELIFDFKQDDQTIMCTLSYDSEQFEDVITSMGSHFITLLSSLITQLDDSLENVSMINSYEFQQIIDEFNQGKKNLEKLETIQQVFQKITKAFPDRTALTYESSVITYKQLDQQSNQIAYFLIEKGLSRGDRVAMLFEPSIDMIINMLAIIKVGGAYVPINPEYPPERIEYTLSDSKSVFILTQKHLEHICEGYENVLIYDENEKKYSTSQLTNSVSVDDIAYIIYTSGSTGNPKGVMISHRNVISLLTLGATDFNFDENDVWTLFHSYCFDFSVWEIYGALLYGGRLVIVPKNLTIDTYEFVKLVSNEKVTVLNQTPPAFYQFIKVALLQEQIDFNLRYVVFGGESLKPGRLKEWHRLWPHICLINMYGITETTVHVTFKEISRYEIDHNINNIGKAIPSLKTYILDENQNLVPIGVPGELYVTGIGIGKGYLFREQLTAERFLKLPFLADEIAYRTGDIVRYLDNGELEYVNRTDFQVKIRGYRIELGEIEACIMNFYQVEEVVVLIKENEVGLSELWAYITQSFPKDVIKLGELRTFLSSFLPSFMIPHYFVVMEAFPLTTNGKTDKKVLSKIETYLIDEQVEFVEAETEIEKVLTSIFSNVLAQDKISIYDNFFERGGDSIKAIQIIHLLKEQEYQLELKYLINYPTIKEVKDFVTSGNIISVDQGLVEGKANLTPIQKSFFADETHHNLYFNQGIKISLTEPLQENKLNKIFQYLVRHHDTLRLKFCVKKNSINQYYENEIEKCFLMHYETFHSLDEHLIKQRLIEIQQSVNLEKTPLVRVAVFNELQSLKQVIYVVIHHLIIDGISWRILVEDFQLLCTQQKNNIDFQLPSKTHSYKKWVETLEERVQSIAFTEKIQYWQELLAEKCTLPLQTNDYSYEQVKIMSITFDSELTKQLQQEIHHVYKTDLRDILLVALGITFTNIYEIDSLLLHLEGHGREQISNEINISRTIGWFTSIYPHRIKVSRDLSYTIRSIKEEVRRIPLKGIDYGILKHLTNNAVDFSEEAKVIFNYLGDLSNSQNEDMEIQPLDIADTVSSSMDMYPYVIDIGCFIHDGKFIMNISYNKQAVTEETVRLLLAEYKRNIEMIVEHCLQQNTTFISPTDLSYHDITIEELDELANLLKIE